MTSSTLRLLVIISLVPLLLVQGALPCKFTAECESLLRAGSQCIDGTCTNPYHDGGCLAQLLPGWDMIRVCHSEDTYESELLGHCRAPDPDLDYTEIRVLTQNWESGFFQSWIIQIVLSEILGIPVTLESGTSTDKLDFYDTASSLGYGLSYDYPALERANEAQDCRLVDSFDEQGNYQSCAHVLTEVWYGNGEETSQLWEDDVIDRPGLMGALGYQGLFIPRFTAEKDPNLLSHLGLKGEENRRKLADTFHRPTSWRDYCSLVSPSRCAEADRTTQRAPDTDAEGLRYFVEGKYNGYFRRTEKNDCDANPTTCTGELVDYPCGWTSFVEQQVHHLNIALESSGDEPVSGGYSYSAMTEIWAAANATRSDVMMRWWTPEALYQTFLATPAEFQIVNMPPATQDCVEARVSMDGRCSAETSDAARLGEATGSCNEPPFSLQRLIVKSLRDSIDDPSVPKETRSPAYEAIKNIQLDELQLGKIFDYWLKRNSDKYNFDPRDASCRWVVENFDLLQTFVPKTYPRKVVEREPSDGALFYIAVSFAILALAFVVIAAVGTVRYRKKRAVRYAQVQFLYLLLAGLLTVAVASVILNLPKSDATCMSVLWLVLQGYTFELVPLILKVAALAHITAAAKRFKRVQLKQKLLFSVMFALSFVLVVFLTAWTVVDPSKETAAFELTEETTEDGEAIIVKSYYCYSQSEAWLFISTGWHGLLLLCATLLAVQTRNMRKEINESMQLAVLVYSHAIFAILRLLLFYLQDRFYVWNLAHYESLIYSVDVIAACCIYFFPKLLCSEDQKVSVYSNIPIIRNLSRLMPPLAGELDGTSNKENAELEDLSIQLDSSKSAPNQVITKSTSQSGYFDGSLNVLGGDDSFLRGNDSVQEFPRSRSLVESSGLEASDDDQIDFAMPLSRMKSEGRLGASDHSKRGLLMEQSKKRASSQPENLHSSFDLVNFMPWCDSESRGLCEVDHIPDNPNMAMNPGKRSSWQSGSGNNAQACKHSKRPGKRCSWQPGSGSNTQAGDHRRSFVSDRGFLVDHPNKILEEVGVWDVETREERRVVYQDNITDEISL